MSHRGLISQRAFWGGGLFEGVYSRMGTYLAAAKKLPGLIFFFYLKLVSMLKTAYLFGPTLFEAISKPEYAEKTQRKSVKKENQMYSVK